MVKVTFLNNDGGGFAKVLELNEGTTVSDVFTREMGETGKPENYLIRVNRQAVSADTVLQDGDRISCTPTKIDGAAVL